MKRRMQNRTKIKQQLVLDQLRANGGNVELACKTVNSSRAQFYVWLNRYSEFADEVEDVYRSINHFARSGIYRKALQQNAEALNILKIQSEKKLAKMDEVKSRQNGHKN